MACFKTARTRIATRLSGASTENDPLWSDEFVALRKARRQSIGGYTLVEVMVLMPLLTLLMIGAAGAISTGNTITRRLSDYTAALAVVEAKVEDIRAATYNPPNSPFTSSTVTLTNSSSIELDQAGATFVVAGTVTSKIEPTASGHLVTVTGTFQTRRSPITVSMQTVVNKYSAGQQ
jgi:Tfp pilus assembly protein PilX